MYSKKILDESFKESLEEEKLEWEIDKWSIAENVARYHDIGKRATKKFFNAKGQPTDIAHYYNHQNVSAYEVISRMRFCELLAKEAPDKEWDFDIDRYWFMIAVLINLHMEPFFRKDAAWEKFSKLIGDNFSEILLCFHEADIKADWEN